MCIGHKIEQFRKKVGRTRKNLADDVGITENGLFKIEKGDRNPSFELARKIAKSLNISLDKFS
ncbi:helix-turn-helix transcriptional regulator [Candidatus Margulisiibacteriota bacterium]